MVLVVVMVLVLVEDLADEGAELEVRYLYPTEGCSNDGDVRVYEYLERPENCTPLYSLSCCWKLRGNT